MPITQPKQAPNKQVWVTAHMWADIPVSLKELVSRYFLTQLTLPNYSTINLGMNHKISKNKPNYFKSLKYIDVLLLMEEIVSIKNT